ncbi:MAG: aminotransferase class V-fold PLP-dependent enzyme [Sphingomicrobium sp.]
MTSRVYLDHAATTLILPEARAAAAAAFERWANPNSPHTEGRAARAALEQARATIGEALGWRHDVILTSGASEAVTIAARRAKVARRIMGATEHDIVPHAMGGDVAVVPVGCNGLVDLDVLDEALAAGPALVAIQMVNNETGVIQPLEAIGEKVRAAGSLWLCDAAQAAGKLDLPDADFIAVSAHKLGGPPGVGALLVRDLATLEPSGGQEKGYRRGTSDVPGAAGLAAALAGRAVRDAMPRLAALRSRLEEEARAAGGVVIADDTPRIATIGAIAMPGVSAASQLVQFDLAGISISAGSACSSGSMKPSHVLAAMGLAPDIADATIRVSFGASTTDADIDAFLAEWQRIASRRRAA